ncbi:MAG: hypothetical protein JNJ60_13245 [Rhodocyclaceae bacterium]|nr:hypothetical protein [Rhodocyclaceae bacterium]
MFLTDEGYAAVDQLPTLVRFRKGDVEVDIYHGRQSYEIGGGISVAGTRYSISELMRVSDPEAAARYRNAAATTPEAVTAALTALSALLRPYCLAASRGDPQFFSRLENQRKQWAEQLALDVLARQLRPQAEDAFRRGDYPKAAELYGRIRQCLSPAEAKKLALAEKRSKA